MSTAIADAPCWRAELTVGTREGYKGAEIVKPADFIPLIEEFQGLDETWYAAIVWTRGTVIGPTFPSETVIKVTLESNPLYTKDATEQDVLFYATELAGFLARLLKQVRVYVAVYPIRSLIVENTL